MPNVQERFNICWFYCVVTTKISIHCYSVQHLIMFWGEHNKDGASYGYALRGYETKQQVIHFALWCWWSIIRLIPGSTIWWVGLGIGMMFLQVLSMCLGGNWVVEENGLSKYGPLSELVCPMACWSRQPFPTSITLEVLHPFQNVGRFDFFRFVYFVMHLDIYYI